MKLITFRKINWSPFQECLRWVLNNMYGREERSDRKRESLDGESDWGKSQEATVGRKWDA